MLKLNRSNSATDKSITRKGDTKMNKKKIIVCAKCDALSYYDSYVWTCPICEQKFKVGAMIAKFFSFANSSHIPYSTP